MINFEELKDFLETIEPDDYEMRLDALSLAIRQVSTDTLYHGSTIVLDTAKEFYVFLKDG